MDISSFMQSIHQNMVLDEELFESFCHILYDYRELDVEHNFKYIVYTASYYIEDLIENCESYSRNKVFEFLESYEEYAKTMKQNRNSMRIFMCSKIPEHFYNCFENSTMDVFFPMRLERQTNAPPPDEPRFIEVQQFKNNLISIMEDNKYMHAYVLLYTQELTYKMNYIKSILFKYDLARNGQPSGTALDIIVNEYYVSYIETQRELLKWVKQLRTMIYFEDANMMDYIDSCTHYDKNCYFRKYFEKEFSHLYKLPLSVLKEVAHNPSIWKYVNMKVKRFSVFGGDVELKPPTLKNGQIIYDL